MGDQAKKAQLFMTLCIVTDYMNDTFRAVYTVKFPSAIVVLHVFKKKSKSGISTPKPEIELIQRRLKQAMRIYFEHSKR
jgi:phage-related protein